MAVSRFWFVFNPPPDWPIPEGWRPPRDWEPDPSWPPPPPGWKVWRRRLVPAGFLLVPAAPLVSFLVAQLVGASTPQASYYDGVVAILYSMMITTGVMMGAGIVVGIVGVMRRELSWPGGS